MCTYTTFSLPGWPWKLPLNCGCWEHFGNKHGWMKTSLEAGLKPCGEMMPGEVESGQMVVVLFTEDPSSISIMATPGHTPTSIWSSLENFLFVSSAHLSIRLFGFLVFSFCRFFKKTYSRYESPISCIVVRGFPTHSAGWFLTPVTVTFAMQMVFLICNIM